MRSQVSTNIVTNAASSTPTETNTTQATNNAGPSSSKNSSEPPVKRAKRGEGKDDLGDRKNLGKSTTEKLDQLLELEAKVENVTIGFTEPARSFVNQILKPILGCLKHHCNGDKNAFIKKCGEQTSTRKTAAARFVVAAEWLPLVKIEIDCGCS